MLHKTTKAATTATDAGIFTALAATYAVDRVGDRIVKGAFEGTIAAWQESQKQVPVHWDHEGSASSVIGSVDPMSMQETEDGLYVEGKLDLEESETAREAWRSMKDNRVSLSFGYMTTRERKAKDGINELLEIDLFEVSIVPAPANPDTRLLSLKSAEDPKTLRKRTNEIALEVAQSCDPPRRPEVLVNVEPPPKFHITDGAITTEVPAIQVDETKIRSIVTDELAKQVSEVEDGEELVEPTPQDPLRKRTYEVALEVSNGGMKVRKHQEPDPEPEPPLDAAELRRRSFEARLSIASGE